MRSFAVPFHFIETFVVAIAATGGLWVAIARPRFAPNTKWMRRFFGSGFVLLALAEVSHGTGIATSELEQSVVALRAGAYALLAGSLLPPEKGKASAAAAAAAPTGTFLPMFLAVPAAWFAFRHPLPAARRLGIAFASFAISEVLFQSCDCLELQIPTLAWFVGHAFRLVGGIAMGAWLWQAIRTSIQARFIAVFLLLLLIVVVSISGAMTGVFARNLRDDATARARDEGRDQRERLNLFVEGSLKLARQLADLDSTRVAVAERNPGLVDAVNRLQAPGRTFDSSDFIAFLDGTGAILAISAEGPNGTQNLNPADTLTLAGTAVVSSALAQQEAASLDTLGANKVVAVAAYPVFNPPGFDPPGAPQSLAGVSVVGNVIDDEYLRTMKRGREDVEAALISRSIILSRTLPDATGILLTHRRDSARVFDQGSILIKTTLLGLQGDEYSSAYIPLRRSDGQVVGALVLSQRSEVLERTQRDIGTRLFLFSLLGTAIAGAFAFLSGSRITRPIRDLTRVAESARAGELVSPVVKGGEDEVGVLAETFGEMTTSLSQLHEDLRSKAEEEARVRKELETILQSMTDGVVAVDQEGKVVAVNREAERILGSSRGAVGRDIRKLISLRDSTGDELKPHIFALEQGSVTGSLARSSSELPVSITSAQIKGEEGEVLGGVAVIRDLTRELEVEKMKTEFLSNISHELRTPLTPIMAYAGLLLTRKTSPGQVKNYAESIRSSARRLERIVQMLVDFSAMEAGRLVPRKSPSDVGAIVTELMGRWAKAAPKHKFSKTGFTKLRPVSLDPGMVKGAINELIDNAVKFDPKGGKILVSAELDGGRNGSGELHLSVTDQGIGIKEDDLSRIEQDFFQLDASATRSFGGLGLGLAYVRRIVEAHGGRLEIKSSPGRGSRFTLVLPSTGVRAPKQSAKAAKRPGSRATSRRPIPSKKKR